LGFFDGRGGAKYSPAYPKADFAMLCPAFNAVTNL